MADFTTLQKKAANGVSRQTSVFLRKTTEDGGGVGIDTYAYYSVGRLKGANLTVNPALSEKDVTGRDMVLMYDIEGTFVLQQTSKNEIATIGSLAGPSGYDLDNGHFIFFSDRPQTVDSVYNDEADGLPSVDGFGFQNVLLKPAGAFPLDGAEGSITVTFSARVSATAFDSFNLADGNILTIDA